MKSDLLGQIPHSPAGRRLRWYMERLISAGEGASAEDRACYTPELCKRIFGSCEADLDLTSTAVTTTSHSLG
jgi:hypothetical protein